MPSYASTSIGHAVRGYLKIRINDFISLEIDKLSYRKLVNLSWQK